MKWIIPALALLAPFAVFAQDSGKGDAPAPAATQNSEPRAAGQTDTGDMASSPLLEGSDSLLDAFDAVEKYLATQTKSEEAQGGQQMVLTARRSVELALSGNAQVAVAQSDLEAAQAKVGQARSQMKPQVKGSMTFTHTEFNTRDISSQLGGIGGGGGGLGGGLGGSGLLGGGLLSRLIPGGGSGGGLGGGIGKVSVSRWKTISARIRWS